jgi:hypothetical protein
MYDNLKQYSVLPDCVCDAFLVLHGFLCMHPNAQSVSIAELQNLFKFPPGKI